MPTTLAETKFRNDISYLYSENDIEILNSLRNQETGFRYVDDTRILVDDQKKYLEIDGALVVDMLPCDAGIEGKTIQDRLAALMNSLENYFNQQENKNLGPIKIFFPYRVDAFPGNWNAAVIDIVANENEKKLSIKGSFYSPLHEGEFDEEIQDEIKGFFNGNVGTCDYDFTTENLALTESKTNCAIYVSRILNSLKVGGSVAEVIAGADIKTLRDRDSELVFENGLADKAFVSESSRAADDLRSKRIGAQKNKNRPEAALENIVRQFQRISSKDDRSKILEVLKNATEDDDKKNNLLSDLKAISEAASNVFIKSTLNGNEIQQELRFNTDDLEFIYKCCENINPTIQEEWMDKEVIFIDKKSKSVLSVIEKIVEGGGNNDRKNSYDDISTKLREIIAQKKKGLAREEISSIFKSSGNQNNDIVARSLHHLLSCDLIEEEFLLFCQDVNRAILANKYKVVDEASFNSNYDFIFNAFAQNLESRFSTDENHENVASECYSVVENSFQNDASLADAEKESLNETLRQVMQNVIRNYSQNQELQKVIDAQVNYENNLASSYSTDNEDAESLFSVVSLEEDADQFEEEDLSVDLASSQGALQGASQGSSQGENSQKAGLDQEEGLSQVEDDDSLVVSRDSLENSDQFEQEDLRVDLASSSDQEEGLSQDGDIFEDSLDSDTTSSSGFEVSNTVNHVKRNIPIEDSLDLKEFFKRGTMGNENHVPESRLYLDSISSDSSLSLQDSLLQQDSVHDISLGDSFAYSEEGSSDVDFSESHESEEIQIDKANYRRDMMAYYWSGKTEEQLSEAKKSYAEKRNSGSKRDIEAVKEINQITIQDLEKYDVGGQKVTKVDRIRSSGIELDHEDKKKMLEESKIRAEKIPSVSVKNAHLVDFRDPNSQGNNRD